MEFRSLIATRGWASCYSTVRSPSARTPRRRFEHLDAALPGDPTIARKAAYLWAVRKLGDPSRIGPDVAPPSMSRSAASIGTPSLWLGRAP